MKLTFPMKEHQLQWIAGVRRDSAGQLRLLVQDRHGKSSQKAFHELSADFGVGARRPHRQDLDLTCLRPGCTREYLRGLDIDHLCAEGQPVYEADGQLGTLVIPSQLLIYALFGSWTVMRSVLLSPLGAASLKVAIGAEDAVRLHHAPYRHDGDWQHRHEKLDHRLMWILGYPSATRAWGSVLRRGLEGRFDMSMPLAHVNVSFAGLQMGAKFLVTNLQVLNVLPYEHPHPFARGLPVAPRKLERPKPRYHVKHDPRVIAPCSDGGLTDLQWSQIEPLVNKLPLRTGKALLLRVYARRMLVEAVLAKLGTPLSWTRLPGGSEFSMSARALHIKLKKIGVWDEIVLRLQKNA